MSANLIKILLDLSFIFAVIAVILAIVRFTKSKTGVLYLVLLVASIWCLRFAVGYYSICEGTLDLNIREEIFDSIIHTFQSFSMDENYAGYVSDGEKMIGSLIAKGAEWRINFYGLFASVLNVLAPVFGGVFVFDILMGIFPRIKFFFKRFAFWKKKYYFSELNEHSLACAHSIKEQKKGVFRIKPLIVFTDVYTDGENEKSSELLKKAKAMGCICINDDLTHINHRFTKNKEYWLIDEKEIDNIRTLSELANKEHYKRIENTVIRIFYQDDSYTLTERKIVDQIKKRYEQYGKKNKKAPAVIRTRCYQNLVYTLLKEEPLYGPLIERENPRSLDIAVLGNGNIGMEMLLSSYWCGQLFGIPLSINVVAKDEFETACAKINSINCDILDSTKSSSELLRVYPDEEIYNDPYFTFRYCKCDVDFENIESISCKVPDYPENKSENSVFSLLDADYYLVALGDDDLNIRVAERLWRAVKIKQREKGAKKITIAYVVYDSHLCESLNGYNNNDDNIRMIAVGSVRKTYSLENIYNEKYMRQQLKKEDDRELSYEDWAKVGNIMSGSSKKTDSSRPYEFWSTYARDIHHNYKAFSAFAKENRAPGEWEEWLKEHKEYICKEKDETADELAWLEHRRWSAYMRSVGFRKGKKDVEELKTHDCLVEHSICQNGKEHFDLLELVKAERRKENKEETIISSDYHKVVPQQKCEEIKKEYGEYYTTDVEETEPEMVMN